MDDLLIVGAGGVGRYVAEQLRTVPEWRERWRLVGFIDDDPLLHTRTVDGLRVLGALEMLPGMLPCAVIIAVASPQAKRDIAGQIGRFRGIEYPDLVHPEAWVAQSAKIGRGVLIYPGVSINHHVWVGDFVTVNMGCVLGHHVQLEDYCSLAPQAGLAGHTVLETGVEFGIGACTIQDCHIGAWSVIGAGAVVIESIPAHTLAVGVPARPKRTTLEGRS